MLNVMLLRNDDVNEDVKFLSLVVQVKEDVIRHSQTLRIGKMFVKIRACVFMLVRE